MIRILALVLCILVASCKNMPAPLASLPPYEDYIRSLEKADLAETPLGRQWIVAGQRALEDSLSFTLPYSETGAFEAEEPAARSYQFEVKEGQVLNVSGSYLSEGRLFTDVFIRDENEWKNIHFNDSTLSFNYEFENTGTCLLRIQPELLTDTFYSLSISVSPALTNPVSGAANRDIGSIYGDPRDGGARSHEGVDIFAPRGTPVIAPTDGRINRVGTGNLGGKVVWMRDSRRGQAYYFAHLDSQLVRDGQTVARGDTIGLVGNTGNARSTPPHLHFGIYQRGSKDPFSYIHVPEINPELFPVDTIAGKSTLRVATETLNVRQGPSTSHEVIRQLSRHELAKVVASSGEWRRIRLPDNTEGYVSGTLLESIDTPVSTITADTMKLVYHAYGQKAIPMVQLPENTKVDVLATFENDTYVRLKDGQSGWIRQ